jgi:hypothetical protein
MRDFVVGLLIAAVLSACSNSNDLGASAKISLDEHQAKWAQRTFDAYSFDLVQDKFGGTTNVHITVNGASIVSVIDKTTGQPPAVDVGWPTIDELYDDAQSALGAKGVTLRIEFDQQYSYPTSVSITSSDPGGPYSAEVSNLVPSS